MSTIKSLTIVNQQGTNNYTVADITYTGDL